MKYKNTNFNKTYIKYNNSQLKLLQILCDMNFGPVFKDLIIFGIFLF